MLALALDGSEWSASRPGRFTPGKWVPVMHSIGGWMGPRVSPWDIFQCCFPSYTKIFRFVSSSFPLEHSAIFSSNPCVLHVQSFSYLGKSTPPSYVLDCLLVNTSICVLLLIWETRFHTLTFHMVPKAVEVKWNSRYSCFQHKSHSATHDFQNTQACRTTDAVAWSILLPWEQASSLLTSERKFCYSCSLPFRDL
jgi:hypothetical protein